MFFRDAESYNRSILREEKQGGRKDEIKKNNGTITCRMHGGITCSLWKRRREKECKKWQLPEPGALMSAKAYRDKKALPLVKKLKEVIKALTIKCVQLTEQGKKLAAKSERQEEKISRLTNRIMNQENVIDKLQEKTADLGRLEHCLGKEQVQAIIEQSKALEQAEKVNKHPKRVFEMDR